MAFLYAVSLLAGWRSTALKKLVGVIGIGDHFQEIMDVFYYYKIPWGTSKESGSQECHSDTCSLFTVVIWLGSSYPRDIITTEHRASVLAMGMMESHWLVVNINQNKKKGIRSLSPKCSERLPEQYW